MMNPQTAKAAAPKPEEQSKEPETKETEGKKSQEGEAGQDLLEIRRRSQWRLVDLILQL